jgi:hypothetical protein
MKSPEKKNIRIIKIDNSFSRLYNNRYFKCLISSFYSYITSEEDMDKVISAMEDRETYNKWIIRYMDFCRGEVLESDVAVTLPERKNS